MSQDAMWLNKVCGDWKGMNKVKSKEQVCMLPESLDNISMASLRPSGLLITSSFRTTVVSAVINKSLAASSGLNAFDLITDK